MKKIANEYVLELTSPFYDWLIHNRIKMLGLAAIIAGGAFLINNDDRLIISHDVITIFIPPSYTDTMGVKENRSVMFGFGGSITKIVVGNSKRPKIADKPKPKVIPKSYSAPKMMSATADGQDKLDYIQRYYRTAISEMQRYKIPASITLAQGLLESDSGKSHLSRNNKNHFGIKCFSKKCGKDHCSIYEDDNPKDRFRKFKTVWESYRAHSKILLKPRYSKLFKLKITDYEGWAQGLKDAGYATDPRYPAKLIARIEQYQLYKYDTQ